MSVDSQLPEWGLRLRAAFVKLFSPLLGACLIGNLLTALGVPVHRAVHGPVAITVVTAILVGFVVTGLGWFCAQVLAGYRRPR